MNRNGQPGPADEFLIEPLESGEQEPANVLLKLHQLLRGRYLWALLTGLILAAVLVVVAVKLPVVQPSWPSVGQIRIKPALDPLLYQTAFNERLADYDNFLGTEVFNLKSQRIILQAMALKKDQLAEMDKPTIEMNQRLKAWDDKTWADVAGIWGPIDNTEQIARLTEGLDVMHPRDTQIIQISFRDHDATLSPVVVKLIIAAYKKLYDVDVDNFNKRMNALKEKEGTLQNSVTKMNESLKVEVGDYGSEEFLLRTLEQKQTEMLEKDQLIGTVELQVQAMARNTFRLAQSLYGAGRLNDADAVLTMVLKVWPDLFPNNHEPEQLREQIAATRGPGTAPAVTVADPLMELTPELAATRDPVMAGYITGRDAAQRRLNIAQTKYGELSEPVRSAKAEVESCQKDIDERLAKLKTQIQTAMAANATEPVVDNGKLTLVDVNDRLKDLRDRRTRLAEETKALQERATKVRTISTDRQTTQQELDTVQSTIHKLNFEGATSGRTEVISPGDKPTRPEKDRRIPAAVGAGLGGLVLGLGIFALIGLFDRRVRSIADARDSLDGTKRILGILPALPDNLTDQDQVSAVAFAVHHIRTLLQLSGSETRSTVFAVTSAAPQDGKTSLTIALGMSYAASGAKTLLIDSDVIGAGLSSRMGTIARPRLGSIMVRKGLISDSQLDAGLVEARKTGSRIGRVLVKLGFINASEKKQALVEQAAGGMGFLDMLDGQALADCSINAGSPNLSVMPVGNLGTTHVGQISVDAVRRIITEARKEFDIVLFDTGPLLGSLEAGIVAAAVDDVIVAVSRGQQIPLLDQTFRRLQELKARVAGIVFNRAQSKDIERSGYASSIASQRNQSPLETLANGQAVNGAGQVRRLGPIAGALTAAPKRPED